jgi:hypothetical protein
MCNQIREDLLDGVTFPLLSANVMYGVLSERLHHPDAGTDLYAGDDEGDAVIRFYEALAKKYGYTITGLKREEKMAEHSCWNQADRRQMFGSDRIQTSYRG